MSTLSLQRSLLRQRRLRVQHLAFGPGPQQPARSPSYTPSTWLAPAPAPRWFAACSAGPPAAQLPPPRAPTSHPTHQLRLTRSSPHPSSFICSTGGQASTAGQPPPGAHGRRPEAPVRRPGDTALAHSRGGALATSPPQQRWPAFRGGGSRCAAGGARPPTRAARRPTPRTARAQSGRRRARAAPPAPGSRMGVSARHARSPHGLAAAPAGPPAASAPQRRTPRPLLCTLGMQGPDAPPRCPCNQG